MNIYIVTNKATGKEVYRYQSAEIVEWDGMSLAICEHTVAVGEDNIEPISSKRRLTKLEFIERLGDAAFIAILQIAKASPTVEAWVEKMKLTTPDPDGTSVDLDDLRTIAGIEAMGIALEVQGTVPTGWAKGVLA